MTGILGSVPLSEEQMAVLSIREKVYMRIDLLQSVLLPMHIVVDSEGTSTIWWLSPKLPEDDKTPGNIERWYQSGHFIKWWVSE